MDILLKEFTKLKNEIIIAYDQKGMRASGEFANSLEVIQDNPFNVKLIGFDYAQQLESGRSAGTMPPISPIKEWIKQKNVFDNIETEAKLTSLAWAIAKKIQQSGWDRKGFGGVDLISDVITPKRIQDIIDKVGAKLAVTYIEVFIEDLEKSF